MAITYEQAVAFRDGPIGSDFPYVERVLSSSNWNNLNNDLKAKYLGDIEKIINNAPAEALKKLQESVSGYVVYKYLPGGGNTAELQANDNEKNTQKYVDFLLKNKTSVSDIQNAINAGQQSGISSLKEQAGRMQSFDNAWFNKVFNVTDALILGGVTGGLGLTPIQTTIINASIQAMNGASAQDIVRGIAGSIAADQIVGALKDINTQIAGAGPDVIKPEVVAALSNAERQAANALITKQDIGAAALAGAGGGAVASATSLATDSAAIQRAAGEYAQALAAGKTQEQALTSALSGFLNQQEKDAAKQKVLDTAALGAGQVGALTGDQAGGTTGDPTKSLPPITVTATDEKVLPQQESVGSFSGTEESQLSLQNKALQTDTKAQPKTSKTNNAILLSLINKPLSRSVPIGSPTQTSSTVGSQALGQALRVGDAGAPVFGGDKDKSKRSGWNRESLRYMGNSGDSNG